MGDAAKNLDPLAGKHWLTMADAALYAGTTVDALQKAVTRGLLRPDAPARKGGCRAHRFLRPTLDAYVMGKAANDGTTR